MGGGGVGTTTANNDVPQIPDYIRYTSMVFCIAIMCLGVIGNIMVPIVILKTKDMRNSTNIFLTNLSIADLLVLLVCTPTVLVEVNTRPETWVLGHEMCKAVPFVELTVAHASVLTILAISFERYYAICEPLKAGYVCTKARALLICLAAWGVAALFTSPILLFAQYSYEEYVDGSQVPVCLTQATSVWAFTFFLMTISVFFLLPLIILVILYAIIARNLITSDTKLKIRLSKPELSVKARKQVVLMLGAVVLSFFTCLLPFRVLTLWIIFVPEETFQSLDMETYYNLLYFCRIMWYLNSAVNPILYNLMSSKFRKGFFKLCRCWLIGRNRHNIKGRARAATFNTTTTSSSCCQYHHHYHCHESENNGVVSPTTATKKTLSLDDLRNMHAIVAQPKNIPRIISSSSTTNLNKIVHTLPRHNKHHSVYNNGMKKNLHATSCCCCCSICENYDEHNQQRTAVVVCNTCNTGALPASSSLLVKNHIKENDLRKLAFKNSSIRRNKARNVSFDETAIYANNQRNNKNIKLQYKKQISLDEHLLRKKIINNGNNFVEKNHSGENKVQCKYGELQYVVRYVDETNDETPQSFAPLLNGDDV